MGSNRFGKNLFLVAVSRLVSLFSSVLVGLLLPKVFSVSDYGFIKIFSLYAAYTTLLHFGFVDGILLKFAGHSYNELKKKEIRTYTRFFSLFEIVLSLLMFVIGAAFVDRKYVFILGILSVNMLLTNITTYYQFVSQAVQRFGDYSAKSLVISVLKLLFVCVIALIYFFGNMYVSYKIYLIGLGILDLFMMIWYIFLYKDITFGSGVSIINLRKNIFDIFKTGITLTMAYQISHLILVMDRQFVNIFFSTETFAIYSFAYNIVSMISTMISSISVVLLPMLKKSDKSIVKDSYKKGVVTVSIVASGALLCYFPLASFIDWFLPNYHDSLEYMAVVLPAFLFASVINVVIFTVAKVLNMNLSYLIDSCIVFVLGIVANIVALVTAGSPKSISFASLVVMIIWFVISNLRMKKRTNVSITKELVYLIVVSGAFITVSYFIRDNIFAFCGYLALFCLVTIAFYYKLIKISIKTVVKKFRKN